MSSKDQNFINTVWGFYHSDGRHDLPWRKTKDPYHILISEVMLQQTQVSRVIDFYTNFIKTWPTCDTLAAAPLSSVIVAWKGLGYNRRAKMLHECAKEVSRARVFPRTRENLLKLPGIGPYTAGAIMAFAYNKPAVMIETNIRTVYLYHYFTNQTEVTDAEVLKVIERTCDHDSACEWYWALMDYGAYLKKHVGSTNKKSKQYKKQPPFKGSTREVRGAILNVLREHSVTMRSLARTLPQFAHVDVKTQLTVLEGEGMVVMKKSGHYTLPG